MEESVADDADADVDGLDVVFNCGDGLFNILQGRVVRERLACVVDFLARVIQTIVNLS